MQDFYFTFGQNHQLKGGLFLGRYYTSIPGINRYDARARMFEERGESWAFCYDEQEFTGQPEKYGLKYIPFEMVSLK